MTDTYALIPTHDRVHNTHILTVDRVCNTYTSHAAEWSEDNTHIHTSGLIPSPDCFHKHAYISCRVFFRNYENFSSTRTHSNTQLAYLFHMCIGTVVLPDVLSRIHLCMYIHAHALTHAHSFMWQWALNTLVYAHARTMLAPVDPVDNVRSTLLQATLSRSLHRCLLQVWLI